MIYVLAILKNFTVGYQNFKYFCKIKNLQYFSVFIKCTGNDVFYTLQGCVLFLEAECLTYPQIYIQTVWGQPL